jgi:hypothetical protein
MALAVPSVSVAQAVPPSGFVILDSGKVEGVDSVTAAARGARSSRTFFPRGKCSPTRACLRGTALALTSLTPLRPSIAMADSVGVRVLIENRGDGRVPATELEIADAQSSERYPVPALDGGEAFELLTRVRSPKPAAGVSCPFTVRATVDPDHMLQETARVARVAAVDVGCEPLSLGIIDFQVTPSVAYPGPALLLVTVRNNNAVGETPETEMRLAFKGPTYDCDRQAFVLVRIPRLGARQRMTVRANVFPWTFKCTGIATSGLSTGVQVDLDPLEVYRWAPLGSRREIGRIVGSP